MQTVNVTIQGKDGEHVVKVEASSLFDSAYQAIQACAKFWWWEPGKIITVELNGRTWRVDPEKVKRWKWGC